MVRKQDMVGESRRGIELQWLVVSGQWSVARDIVGGRHCWLDTLLGKNEYGG